MPTGIISCILFRVSESKSFIEYLRDLMAERGLNETGLSRTSGLAQPTINRILNRSVSNYHVETLIALAKGLSVEPLDLIESAIDEKSRTLKNRAYEFYANRFNEHTFTDEDWKTVEEKFFMPGLDV